MFRAQAANLNYIYALIFTMLCVSALYIYPVKSLGGIALQEARLEARGLALDRRWMLVDAANNFMSQREIPAMALLTVGLEKEGLLITHTTSGRQLLVPYIPATNNFMQVTVWEDTCLAQQVSPYADEWFSDLLHCPCKLVYMPDHSTRLVEEKYAIAADITSFSDGYPNLLIGQASLDDLNNKLAEPITMQRFRPNIVFTGGMPFEEDYLAHFTINDISFYGVKRCARCVVTTINPDTAEKGKEPLRTLASYRQEDNKIYFGQNLLHKGVGSIHVGDELKVLQRK
jgi:uncharacterized protein